MNWRRHLLIAAIAVPAGYLFVKCVRAEGSCPYREVLDGDTFCLGGSPVRIWGIDAPERGQPFGPQATRILADLLRGSHSTSCELRSKDRYGRQVVRCILAKGAERSDLGEQLVARGAAWDWPAYSNGHYAYVQGIARAEGRGLWALPGEPIEPWKWRASR